jgi:hypothetical protein
LTRTAAAPSTTKRSSPPLPPATTHCIPSSRPDTHDPPRPANLRLYHYLGPALSFPPASVPSLRYQLIYTFTIRHHPLVLPVLLSWSCPSSTLLSCRVLPSILSSFLPSHLPLLLLHVPSAVRERCTGPYERAAVKPRLHGLLCPRQGQ